MASEGYQEGNGLQGSDQNVYVPRICLGRICLELSKTPAFMEDLMSKISQDRNEWNAKVKIHRSKVGSEKLKCSRIPALNLKIGSWKRESTHPGHIVAKIYYQKKKILWEILEGSLKRKFEMRWDQVRGIKTNFTKGQPDTLQIQLKQQPLYYHEIGPVSCMHTLWTQSSDFTGGQAETYSTHCLKFPEGTLEKHFESLMYSDRQLYLLNQWAPSPNSNSKFIEEETNRNQASPYALSFNQPSFHNQVSLQQNKLQIPRISQFPAQAFIGQQCSQMQMVNNYPHISDKAAMTSGLLWNNPILRQSQELLPSEVYPTQIPRINPTVHHIHSEHGQIYVARNQFRANVISISSTHHEVAPVASIPEGFSQRNVEESTYGCNEIEIPEALLTGASIGLNRGRKIHDRDPFVSDIL